MLDSAIYVLFGTLTKHYVQSCINAQYDVWCTGGEHTIFMDQKGKIESHNIVQKNNDKDRTCIRQILDIEIHPVTPSLVKSRMFIIHILEKIDHVVTEML